ncbi:F-box only protein 34 [Corythoichthys intestinalis]|uniref:F-box only protein 34 n=1 Tax=Corythoichthys intestinalis TaxID=161448 RepID=UPI0025A68B84|nr:F-box only protein 34 [Corythoichthys intestinalis]
MHIKPVRSELRVNVTAEPSCCRTEDAVALLDMWAVIKPGHVREKIALFVLLAPEPPRGGSQYGEGPLSPRTGKVKGRWREKSIAKRRRKSAGRGNQNLHRDPGTTAWSRPPSPEVETAPCCQVEDSVALPDMWAVIKPGYVREKIALFAPPEVETARQTVSVGATVAFLEERRASRRHAQLSVARTEDLESVRVSDMVAKLECLQHRNEELQLRRPLSCPPAVSDPELIVHPRYSHSDGAAVLEMLPSLEETEPIPGLLFLSTPSPSPAVSNHSLTPIVHQRSPPSLEKPSSLEETEPPPGLLFMSTPLPPPSLKAEQAETAKDFPEMRRQLCEVPEALPDPGTPSLAALPPDVLLAVFALLPTRALAALKCSCRYFKFIIENYGVRPADSLWVSDPRYRDDPCKRCKRRYVRGDVSLCRWHRKPYFQALPDGPGFWMCCPAWRRDAPGCSTGLHDNRWVPSHRSVAVCHGNVDG